jgi:hypothetical protein
MHLPAERTEVAPIIDIAIESLDQDELECLRDACNRRLLRMRHTDALPLRDLLRLLEAVKTTLHDQDKGWHSLERWQWLDGQIRFWLNPIDQTHYRMGWFGIDDLIAWAADAGPIVMEVAWDADAQDDDPRMQPAGMRWIDSDPAVRSP